MSAIANLVTGGIGPGSAVKYLVTGGLDIGEPPAGEPIVRTVTLSGRRNLTIPLRGSL